LLFLLKKDSEFFIFSLQVLALMIINKILLQRFCKYYEIYRYLFCTVIIRFYSKFAAINFHVSFSFLLSFFLRVRVPIYVNVYNLVSQCCVKNCFWYNLFSSLNMWLAVP
jgi:hypothetical protein